MLTSTAAIGRSPPQAQPVSSQPLPSTIDPSSVTHPTHGFDYLDAPVARVAGKDVPMPYAANLEKLALPNADEVVQAAKAVLYV